MPDPVPTRQDDVVKVAAPIRFRAVGRQRGLLAVALVLSVQVAAVHGEVDPQPPLTMRGHDPRIQAGIDLIYGLRFEEADRYFDRLIEADPANPLGHFFRAMTSWWRVLIDLEDDSHDEMFYDQLQACMDVCDARLKQDADDFDAILFKAGAIGFRGRLRGDRGKFLGAARDGLRSLPMLKRSRDLEPTNKDILFGQGIYDYFAVILPRKYPIIRPIMWFMEDGDKERGLRELDEVARQGQYARVEARYFLAQIYRVFERDYARALVYLTQLRRQYPDNSVFHRNTARTLAALDRWEPALELYREFLRRSEAGDTGFHVRGRIESLYYLGKRAFNQQRATDAISHFEAADSLSYTLGDDRKTQAVRGYVPLANLYMGMAYDELARRELAIARYERVRELPRHGRSHEWARKYTKEAYTRPASSQTEETNPLVDPTPLSQ